MSAADALFKYSKRHAGTGRKRTKKNKAPEFEFRKEFCKWLDQQGFLVSRVESKAVYSQSAGIYLSGQAQAGFSDLVCVGPFDGIAFFIELKAPGKRSTIKPHQLVFLRDRIKRHAFACVTDSVEHFSILYMAWSNYRKSGSYGDAMELLLGDLPKGPRETEHLALDK